MKNFEVQQPSECSETAMGCMAGEMVFDSQ
jgi:hypothetical protein